MEGQFRPTQYGRICYVSNVWSPRQDGDMTMDDTRLTIPYRETMQTIVVESCITNTLGPLLSYASFIFYFCRRNIIQKEKTNKMERVRKK